MVSRDTLVEAFLDAAFNAADVSAGSESGGGTKDFLGYYALLGLDGELRGSISSSDIKRAFQEAAMRWHPDRLHVSWTLPNPTTLALSQARSQIHFYSGGVAACTENACAVLWR